MKLSTKPYKGARDFYPEDKRLQKYLFGVMRAVCERYGYEEYDAPILEPTDLYLQKGNQEIIEEQTYTFTDRGDRSVTLRTEMTPSVARMVAGNRQELGYPLRWYSIPQCWRYERMQRGRGREFYQLNVDIFGEDSIAAEYELISIVKDLMSAYGASEDMYEIHVSSRAFLREVLYDQLGVSPDKEAAINRLIDKKSKIGEEEFAVKLRELLGGQESAAEMQQTMTKLLDARSISDIPENLQQSSALEAVRELMMICENSGMGGVLFNPSITRGFDYYTDIVFEVFDTNSDNNRSMFGGGRYDSLVADFGVDPVPTVGFGMGDHTLLNFLELHDLLPKTETETDIYAICVGDTYQAALDVTEQLREKNINVALDVTGRKLDKCIKAADKKGIAHVLFIGQEELEKGTFTLRNIVSGEETTGDVEAISQAVLS